MLKLTNRCDMCQQDELDVNLFRTYEYINDKNELIVYKVCEDCIYNHKKNNWKLGHLIG